MPQEGEDFGEYLFSGKSFKEAFFCAGEDNQDLGPISVLNDRAAYIYRIAYIGEEAAGSLNDSLYSPLENITDRTTRILTCEVKEL